MDNENNEKWSVDDIKRLVLEGCALLVDMAKGDAKRDISLRTDTFDKVNKKLNEEDDKKWQDEMDKEFNPERYRSNHPIKSAINDIKDKIFNKDNEREF